MDSMNDRELFLAFQKRWSIEKVKAMTLEKYTSTKALSKTIETILPFRLKIN